MANLITELTAGERWISFLRGYGPVNRTDSMYAETIRRQANAFGVEPLHFDHPVSDQLGKLLRPDEGQLTNVILTGTAGDGKTTLCNELWHQLGGDDSRITGRNCENYLPLEVLTPEGPRTIHFIFEFSGFAPEQGQPWPSEKLELLDRLAVSILDPDPLEFFVMAANDGKLVHEWEGLPENSGARRLAPSIEELLALGHQSRTGLLLQFLNLSRMPTREILHRALDNLLARSEWVCFADEGDDPAFGPESPLRKNHNMLVEPSIRSRLEALADLCDANGLHVSIREVLLLLINGLLGHGGSSDFVMRPSDLRALAAEGRAHEAALYNNLFGGNLPERRREHFAVFRYLSGFRIGLETTNAHDGLLVFGPDDPQMEEDHQRLLANDPAYGENANFAQLRVDYLEAEETRADAAPFLKALITERRRLFFRLSEKEERFDPWRLTVFHSAGDYLNKVLDPLRKGALVDLAIVSTLVRGLNRIWTGMLAGDLDRLYLSTGLDFSSARISDIYLYEVPLLPNIHGDGISVRLDEEIGLPVLRVTIGKDHGADFPLHLIRFEFLTRVALGALPSSFSKECYEDVIAFKTQVLAAFYRLTGGQSPQLSLLSPGPDGALVPRQLNISL